MHDLLQNFWRKMIPYCISSIERAHARCEYRKHFDFKLLSLASVVMFTSVSLSFTVIVQNGHVSPFVTRARGLLSAFTCCQLNTRLYLDLHSALVPAFGSISSVPSPESTPSRSGDNPGPCVNFLTGLFGDLRPH